MTLILRAVPRRMLAPFGNQDLVAEGLTRAWSGSQECDEDRVLQRRLLWPLGGWELLGESWNVGQLSQRLHVH